MSLVKVTATFCLALISFFSSLPYSCSVAPASCFSLFFLFCLCTPCCRTIAHRWPMLLSRLYRDDDRWRCFCFSLFCVTYSGDGVRRLDRPVDRPTAFERAFLTLFFFFFGLYLFCFSFQCRCLRTGTCSFGGGGDVKLVAQQCAQSIDLWPLEPSVVTQAPLRTTPCCALCARAVLDSVHWSFFS